MTVTLHDLGWATLKVHKGVDVRGGNYIVIHDPPCTDTEIYDPGGMVRISSKDHILKLRDALNKDFPPDTEIVVSTKGLDKLLNKSKLFAIARQLIEGLNNPDRFTSSYNNHTMYELEKELRRIRMSASD